MLEVLIVMQLSKQIGDMAWKKGYSEGLFRGLFIAGWFLGELIMIAIAWEERNYGMGKVYMYALMGALGGSGLAWLTAVCLPPKGKAKMDWAGTLTPLFTFFGPVILLVCLIKFTPSFSSHITSQLRLLYELHDELALIGDEEGVAAFTKDKATDLDERYRTWEKRLDEFLRRGEKDEKKIFLEEFDTVPLIAQESMAVSNNINKQLSRLRSLPPPNTGARDLAKRIDEGYKSRALGVHIFELMKSLAPQKFGT